MAAAEFHSPPRSLAESYAQDLILQQQQQQQAAPPGQLHSSTLLDRERERERERDRERDRDRERERERLSPGMESVLGRMPVMTPGHPAAGPSTGVAGSLEGSAPVEHYLGPKRKRGRPPLDDAYDVFNVWVFAL